MTNEHADTFFRMGTIRIGTLYEYWRTDLHGEEIGDNQEGLAFCSMPKNELESIMNDESRTSAVASFVRNMVRVTPGVEQASNFTAGYLPLNQYMYCVTTEFSEEVMKEFGYSACIEIVDVETFFGTISTVLQFSADPRAMCKCDYRSRGFKYEEADSVFPEIIKDPRYSYQKELRALWWPKYPEPLSALDPDLNPAPEIAPLIIPCSNLIETCTRVC